jgi:hypothetical protein
VKFGFGNYKIAIPVMLSRGNLFLVWSPKPNYINLIAVTTTWVDLLSSASYSESFVLNDPRQLSSPDAKVAVTV